MTYKIRSVAFIIVCISIVGASCVPNVPISDLVPVGSKLTDSILFNSQQIIPKENYLVTKGDVLNTTGKYQPYILIFDKHLRLISSKEFTSHLIDSIIQDTIYYVKSGSIHWYGRDRDPVDFKLALKPTKPNSVKHGTSTTDKMVRSLSYDARSGILKVLFLKSDNRYEGSGVAKSKFSDSSFVNKFYFLDSLTVPIEKLMFRYNGDVLIHEYLDKNTGQMNEEEMIIPTDSIWTNLFESIRRKYSN